MERRLFTSESVTEGHPDKMCDQISDAILDALMEQDPMSRVACETATTTGMVLVMGEITTNAYIDIQKIVQDMVEEFIQRDRVAQAAAHREADGLVLHRQQHPHHAHQRDRREADIGGNHALLTRHAV
mgnify:CR=1 FL=1